MYFSLYAEDVGYNHGGIPRFFNWPILLAGLAGLAGLASKFYEGGRERLNIHVLRQFSRPCT